MKKKLLALFLTAVLAVSSMSVAIPITAAESETEPEPIEVGTEFIKDATTAATKVNVEDGNGYLHLYDRQPNRRHNGATHTDLQTALGYQMNNGYHFLYNDIYYVKLRARIANNWAAQAEAKATNSAFADDATDMYFKLVTGGSMKVFNLWGNEGYNYGNKWDDNPNIALAGYVGDANLKQLYLNGIKPADSPNAVALSAKFANEVGKLPTSDYIFKSDSQGGSVALTNEWSTLVYAVVPRFGYVVGEKNQQFFFSFASADGLYRNIPVDIDDFEMWYYDSEGNKQSVASYDFDDIDNPEHVYQYEPSDRYGKFFSVDGASRSGYNKHFKVSNITETDYYEVKVPQTGNTATGAIDYTFSADTVLDPGVYEFTAEARLNFYDGYLDDTVEVNGQYPVQQYWQFIENEDNTANLNVKINGESIGNCDVKSEWAPVTFTYTVPKGLNVTLESIIADFTDDTYSVNKAFDLRNVKFTKTETFIPDDEFEDSEADMVYTIEDDAFVASGASDAKVELTYPDSYTEGNRYLTVKGRTNERDGFILDLRGIVDNSESNDYRLAFKVRASRELSNLKINSTDPNGYSPSWTMIKLSAGLYRGDYVTAVPSTFQPNGQSVAYYRHRLGSSGAYWWYFDNTGWKTIDIPFNDFVQEEEGVSTRYNVIHFGGAETAYNAVSFDIDDIIVYSASQGQDNPIWTQDFRSERVGELSKSLSARFVPFKETWLADSFRTQAVALEIGEDAPYFTASGVNELKYSVPSYSPITFAHGVYTVHADFSYPYFDGDRITTDVGSARLRNYIKENNNKFHVSAVIETEDDTIRTSVMTVDNNWTDCKFKFNIDGQTDIKSISFVFTDASGAQYTTVCYRDIYIDGNYPEEPGKPYVGIVMMLLLQKKAEVKAEADIAEADEDRALSDKEVVYPIIDGSFKTIADGRASKVKNEYPESFEKGNKYLRVNGRGNNRDGLILDLRRAVLDVSEAEYRLSFKVRSASKIVDIRSNNPKSGPFTQRDVIRLGEGLYNGAYTPASPAVFGKATINSAGFDGSQNGWYFDNNAWTTIDVSFKELKNQNVIHIGGGSLGAHCSDFDIDDVMIYVKGEAEPIYLEDFEDAERGELGTNLSYFYVPFQNGNVDKSYRLYNVALEIEEDRDYVTSGGADELKYTAEDGEMSLAAGEYTLHAALSYPYYDGKGIEIAETDDSKKQSYFKSNTNTFDVTAVIETDGGTLTFDTYTVRSAWTDCEFNFKLEEDTEIKSVSFKLTPAGGAKSTAVNLRGVYIDGDLAK